MRNLPSYELTLHKSYYNSGFFNLGVVVDRFVKNESGPVRILLGDSKSEISGKVDRKYNRNATPRIFGGAELRNWFQKHFILKEIVVVYIISPSEIWIKNV